MKVSVFALILGSTLFCLPFGFSQDDAVLLRHEVIRAHQRPPVKFNHDKHSETIECNRCHHEYDENGNNVGGDEGQPCSEFHGLVSTEENPVPLVRAFHIQCKTCHEGLLAKGERSGPVMCGQCHVR